MGDVVVLGAGYAGVMAANRLAGLGESVRLVSPHEDFIERIRLHRVVAGTRPSARVPLQDLVHSAVERISGIATRIDAAAQTVHLADGRELAYDSLVYAVGSGAIPERMPSGGNPYRISDETSALALRDALRAQPDAPVTIVGAGLTGIELAAVLADRPAGLRLITASSMTERAAERAHVKRLRRLGVRVETGTRAEIADLPGIVVTTTGFRVPQLAATSGLPTDGAGRLIVGEDLTVAGIPTIVGAGDAVVVRSLAAAHLRMACATALPMGAHAADVVASNSRGLAPQPFSMGYLAQCSDLGGPIGRVQLVGADDSERSFALPGVLGGLLKEQVCRFTLTWLRQERDRAGRYAWRNQPARPQGTRGAVLGSA